MLKDFWENKKHLIQMVGILTGVGALFLSIPLPIDEQARSALLNLQFVWLVVISVSAVALLFQLLSLLGIFERKLKQNYFDLLASRKSRCFSE